MAKVFLDTEGCGLTGPTCLIQYAVDDGPIQLHSVWTTPVKDTMELIEWICNQEVIGFNLAFDWFHFQQLYTCLSLLRDKHAEPDILEYASIEAKARDVDICLKPKSALDLFLHAKKGPYQSLMEREDVRIKRVPVAIAYMLAEELERSVHLPDIYFARRSDKNAPKWKVMDIEEEESFKDVVLTFAPTSALKALCIDALKLNPDDVMYFADVSLPKKAYPEELGYAPFALALAPKGPVTGDWKGAWPEKISNHITHWAYNELARKYAAKDVELTRELYKFFGSPEMGDVDSILACSVGAIRWRGYRVDLDKIRNLKAMAVGRMMGTPIAPNAVRAWIEPDLSDEEKSVLTDTKKVTLEAIAEGPEWDGHPAQAKAKAVLDARSAQKEIELYDKLLIAGRFHASFKIIGALSGRMSGADDLNPQGIKATDEVRSCFPLAWDGQILTGGDFSGFEVVLADAVYNDPDLHRDLTEVKPCTNCAATGKKNGETCKVCGGKGKGTKKIHGLFGQHVFTDLSYDEIVESAGAKDDLYSKAKRAVFAMLYGGEGHTLKERLGVDLETAEKAYIAFTTKYKQVGAARRKVFDAMCSMRQPGGIGTEVVWAEPADFIETIFGFRRYFTLENKVCKALFMLANDPPEEWLAIKIKVVRRDRVQTAGGATRSALFGAAFAIQAQNMRSGANHVIQGSGAFLTKVLQTMIWNLQPTGIHPWEVMPMNIHDEINCPTKPEVQPKIVQTVKDFVEIYKKQVPLLKMDWKDVMADWSGKH